MFHGRKIAGSLDPRCILHRAAPRIFLRMIETSAPHALIDHGDTNKEDPISREQLSDDGLAMADRAPKQIPQVGGCEHRVFS